ncbi:MAG TPA: adenylate/guanylate cyclase domain-containing protein [Gaiellaceae bacterium]|nr:adenylate/guanylate cyclase domain-containing protein [Gaiellaceae bacterium]
MSALPSGTVTFLFTDIEGSTDLLRTLGDGYAELLRQERGILRETLTRAEGREIDTQGDAFFFSFPRARDAIAGAVTAQRALGEHEWPEGVEVKVRMGLHTGEPTVGDEGYLGLDVVRAARICSAGHGGQILMSETTRALLGDALPDRTTLRDLGRRSLKDVGEERIFQLTLDGRDDFAPLKTERGWSRSAANVLGDDFEQRIEDLVKSSIAGRLPGASPPEPPSKPFWSRFGRRPRR